MTKMNGKSGQNGSVLAHELSVAQAPVFHINNATGLKLFICSHLRPNFPVLVRLNIDNIEDYRYTIMRMEWMYPDLKWSEFGFSCRSLAMYKFGFRAFVQHLGHPVLVLACAMSFFLFVPAPTFAQAGVFGSSWVLDSSQSSIRFQTIKNGSTFETSSFATFSGEMNSSGEVTLQIRLDSLDTKSDLRNVRLRFLLFETYNYPAATVTTRLDASVLQALEEVKRLQIPVEFELDLHGMKKLLTADTVITRFADDEISINTISPVVIDVADFDMLGGIAKLEDAADVSIVPISSVLFDLGFKRQLSEERAESPEIDQSVSIAVALESVDDFSQNECINRFEVLSQSDAINFGFNSSEIRASSFAFLDSLTDIVNRCSEMNVVIEGHTDSQGSESVNLRVSSSRAAAVYEYLIEKGVADDRMRSLGYGESRPLVPNNTPENRARNRRIEFLAE